MQENSHLIQQLFTIKAGTMIAGLAGAFVRLLIKTEGSLQARIVGFLSAIFTIVYLLPFLIWLFEWKFAVAPEKAVEQILSFVCGLVVQTFTENFVDDPGGSLTKWVQAIKKFKRQVMNGETMNSPVPPSILADEKSEDKKQ